MDFDKMPVSCAIIKVEKKENNLKNKGEVKDGPKFKVLYEDILETTKFIELTLDELKMNDYVVYICGFDIIPQNRVWTKKQIVEGLIIESNKNNIIQNIHNKTR